MKSPAAGRHVAGLPSRPPDLLAFQLNRHQTDQLLCVTRELRVDLETLLLWGVLAHQNVVHLMPPGTRPAAVLDERSRGEKSGQSLRAVRLHDLTLMTGIPRETARRKLLALEETGRIRRVVAGWVARVGPYEALARESIKQSARRLCVAADDVGRVLDSGMSEGDASVS